MNAAAIPLAPMYSVMFLIVIIRIQLKIVLLLDIF